MTAAPPSRRRSVAVAAAALALVAVAAPLLPDATTPEPALTPQSERLRPSGTAGRGAVTPEMQAEIDRVVAEGMTSGRTAAGASPYQRAQSLARCADLDGQRYCLGVGWTTQTESQVASRLAAPPAPGRERTGDLDPDALFQRQARLTPAARAAAERRELTDAARSVAKVWLLRHEIQGVPLPADFAQRHPEAVAGGSAISSSPVSSSPASARGTTAPTPTPTPAPTSTDPATTTDPAATTTSTTTPAPAPIAEAPLPKTAADYPETFKILKEKQVRPQSKTYYCGPTTMQMIAWGWRDRRQGQSLWADRLNTTSAGTAITDMVRVVNNNTGYDNTDHAGAYVVVDIADFTFDEWYLLMMKHIHDFTAPVVMHPILLKRYYPYIDDDASGHFQVGRGFDQNPGGTPQIGYFEPWDQSRFDPSEPRIPRSQWRSAYKSYRANQAHFQHNLGV